MSFLQIQFKIGVSDLSKAFCHFWFGLIFFVSFQSTQLQMNMERLKDEWADFLKEQQRLKEKVDEEHAKEVKQLSSRYCEMKKDLTKFSPL